MGNLKNLVYVAPERSLANSLVSLCAEDNIASLQERYGDDWRAYFVGWVMGSVERYQTEVLLGGK